MYPNNNCNNCDDCPPICITFTIGGERLQPYPCATEQAGIYNNKPYYQLYEPGCTQLADLFVWWNDVTNRWEYTTAIGSTDVFCYNVNPGLHPISTNSYKWIENLSGYLIVSSVEGPCPGPLPLPNLSGLCGEEYNAACVIYTGEDITCLGIESGMTFLEVLDIFNNTLPICDCCEKVPQDCVLSAWGSWGSCECYYEDELLVCGRRSRTRTIITPAANGGAPCGPLVEYQACDVEDVCFTFGSNICESAPNATQLLASPAGILNNKPYYLLEFSCGAPDLYVWYSNSTLLWHITPVLGTTNSAYQTLNNSSNYLPISNNTTQRWSFIEGGSHNDLITSQTTTCPDVNICFKFVIDIEAGSFTFYANIAPSSLAEGSFPLYEWSNNEIPYGPYIITVGYSVPDDTWVYVVSNAIDTTPLEWGTLDTNTFYPLSTSTIQWQPVENIAGSYNSEILSSTQDACTQPPDVDCVWTCTDWSACNAGCTQTRTCTITTPASGNGTCEPSPSTQQSCCVPSCGQPITPIVEVISSNIVITFTAVAGAVQYTLSYTSDGGATYTNVISTTPSFSFPWECGKTYSGWIVTNCLTLNSAQTTFSITMDPCPVGPPCGALYAPFISGVRTGGNPSTIRIDSDGVASAIPQATSWIANGSIGDAKLTSTGFFIGGAFTQLPLGSIRWGFSKLLCNGQVDPSFIVTTGFIQYSGAQTGRGTVLAVDVDTTLQRVYVGGDFSKWNGTTCNNIVCLDYSGGIVTAFNTGTGITTSIPGGSATVTSIKIQPDGKILVGGDFYIYNGTAVRSFMRLRTDGTLDPAFSLGTSFVDFPNNYPKIQDIQLDSNGNIYVAGQFVSYQGVNSKSFVKIRSTGIIETGFPILNKFVFPSSAVIIKVSLIVGNFIYIGGFFNSYNGTTAAYLVKLNISDASIVPGFALNTTLTTGGAINDIKLADNGNILIASNLQGYRSSTNKFYHILDPNTGDVVSTTYPTFPADLLQITYIGIV